LSDIDVELEKLAMNPWCALGSRHDAWVVVQRWTACRLARELLHLLRSRHAPARRSLICHRRVLGRGQYLSGMRNNKNIGVESIKRQRAQKIEALVRNWYSDRGSRRKADTICD
jgi:hypothetical protein